MEVRADKGDELKPGDKVLCDVFAEKDHVDVIGTSKGKGFMGVVAPPRLPRRRARPTARCSTARRARSAPRRSRRASIPGTRSSGRLGGRQATAKNLSVVRVDAEKNLLYISGAGPGRPATRS